MVVLVLVTLSTDSALGNFLQAKPDVTVFNNLTWRAKLRRVEIDLNLH